MKKKISIIVVVLGLVMIITGIILALTNNTATTLPKEEQQEEAVSIEKYRKEMIEMLSYASSSLTYDVNNLEYYFTMPNTIYAVPLACIAYREDDDSSVGKWSSVSNESWAYILVHYDDDTSSYDYGYTFKDSDGYGIYPTATYRAQESESEIQKNLQLNKPTTGLITNITSIENWVNFNKFSILDENTNLIVVEATKEGNNIDTCTIK